MSLADTEAWCTLADVKGELGITTSDEDARLERLIRSVSEDLQRDLGYKVRRESVTDERHRGEAHPTISLDRAPLDEGEEISVAYDGSQISSDSFEVYIPEMSVLYFKFNTPWFGMTYSGPVYERAPDTARKLITVSYTAGWVLPNDSSGTRDFPFDLENVAIERVVGQYRRGGRDPSIQSESLGPWSVKYGSASAMHEAHERVLARYRRVVQA